MIYILVKVKNSKKKSIKILYRKLIYKMKFKFNFKKDGKN
jgi:hypothetical protein